MATVICISVCPGVERNSNGVNIEEGRLHLIIIIECFSFSSHLISHSQQGVESELAFSPTTMVWFEVADLVLFF